MDDPDLGAASLDDDAIGVGGDVGGSGLGAGLEDLPDNDEGEVAPRHQPVPDHQGASSSVVPADRGGMQKPRAAPFMFANRPKKSKSSAAATKPDVAAAKATRFCKVVKEPHIVSV